MKLESKLLNIPNDPIKIFESISKKSKYCFLLETLADKYQPMSTRQSYIG